MSADGRTIEYWAHAAEQSRGLRRFRMPADRSAPPVSVGDVGQDWNGDGVWLESGDLICSNQDGLSYVRVPASGGSPRAPVRLAIAGYPGGRFYPQGRPLPGDRGLFLRAIWYQGQVYHQGIAILDPRSGKAKMLIQDGGSPAYHAGILCFSRQDALFAIPFDLGKMEIRGEPVGIMNDLRQTNTSLNAGFGYASAACGSDILFLEAIHALRGKTVVVLPYAAEEFAQDNVSRSPGEWPPRFARVRYG